MLSLLAGISPAQVVRGPTDSKTSMSKPASDMMRVAERRVMTDIVARSSTAASFSFTRTNNSASVLVMSFLENHIAHHRIHLKPLVRFDVVAPDGFEDQVGFLFGRFLGERIDRDIIKTFEDSTWRMILMAVLPNESERTFARPLLVTMRHF